MAEHGDSPLRDYVQRVMREKGLSYPEVAAAAKKRGGDIGKSTVQQIATGTTTNPGIFTLQALALGLNRPFEEVLASALGTPLAETNSFHKSEWANVWELSSHLPLTEQRIIKRYLQMLEREIERLLSGY